MRLVAKYPQLFERISVYFSTGIRLLLNILLVIIVVALLIGIYKAGHDLATSLNKPLETILQQILLDTVFIVALLEIGITVLGYLKDGMVHVRYIIDTILIIMLNEVITIWFKGGDLEKSIGISIILLTLGIVRTMVLKYNYS